jgi:hypothetical protein
MSENYSINLQIWRIGISVVLQIGWQLLNAAIMAGIGELGGAVGFSNSLSSASTPFPNT